MGNRWLPGVNLFLPEVVSWEERHSVIAQLLYESAMCVGGISVKAMQFVGLRDDLPLGYREWFSKAQEETSICSPPSYVEEALAEFSNVRWEPEPRKSASIAQVHFGSWEDRHAVFKVRHEHV